MFPKFDSHYSLLYVFHVSLLFVVLCSHIYRVLNVETGEIDFLTDRFQSFVNMIKSFVRYVVILVNCQCTMIVEKIL